MIHIWKCLDQFELFAETIEEEDLCSSNHFILDRIAEKESTDNLHRSGSEHEEVEDADIRQVGDLDEDDDDDEDDVEDDDHKDDDDMDVNDEDEEEEDVDICQVSHSLSKRL